MPKWFADYAACLFERLGDRVPLWCTINEPWVVVDAGYVHGVNAPGHRDWLRGDAVATHLLLRRTPPPCDGSGRCGLKARASGWS